jgi:hypothetical protein
MRSISAAMTWDLWRRGRWTLGAVALTMLALPMLILWMIGNLHPDSGEDFTHLLNFLFLQTVLVTGIGALMALNMQNSRRLYPYPATSATLLNGQLLPSALLLAVGVVLWTLTANGLFELGWPSWEPALFGIAALVAAHAAMWLCMGSLWMIPLLAIVSGVFGSWMKWHFGSLFDDPVHAWTPITPAEAIMLAGATIVSYRGALMGLARARRGEPPISVGLVKWLDSLADRAPATGAPFPSAAAAQTWYFQQRGWVAPATVFAFITFALAVWSFVSRDVVELVAAFANGGWFISIAAVLGGIALGSVGNRDDVVMGQFLATRPITSLDLSRRLLIVAVKNLAFAWIIWGTVLLAIMLVLRLAGHSPWTYLPAEFRWQSLAGAMLLTWAVMASVIALALWGRAKLVSQLFVGLSLGYVSLMLLAKFGLNDQAREALMHGLVAVTGLAFTAMTVVAFGAARKRGLIETPVAVAAIAIWIVLLGASMMLMPADFNLPRSSEFLLYGSLALVVAPIALAPLAITWNRTR